MALRHALRTDLDGIADLYVDAFADDPFFRWVQPDDAGWPAFGRAWFGFVVSLTFERGHTYLDDGPDVAVAWVPPDIALVGPDEVTRATRILEEHAGPERAGGALETILAARAHLLDEPHWTLQYVGVRKSQQGRGLGAASIGPGLAVCDAASLPCAVISTNPKNVSLYERLGFTGVAEVATPDGAAAMRPMVRR